MPHIIRIIGSIYLLALSYEETQAVWTTVILSLVLISIEATGWMIKYISKQAKAISIQMDEIMELLDK